LKNKFRISALALAALIFSLTFAAGCGGDAPASDETTAAADVTAETESAETDRGDIPDDLPDDLDFGGEEFTIHVRGDETSYEDFFSEQTGDIIDDVIYNRNRAVEERLNTAISVYRGKGWETYNDELKNIRNAVQAGDDSWDVIAGWSARIPIVANEGLFLNLYELPYLNLDREWWVQTLKEELTIGGKLYFATGDITLTLLEAAYVICFNKALAADYGVPDLYEAVNNGSWTLDMMAKTASLVSADLNGDGKYDENDLYGCAITSSNNVDCFLQSSGIKMIVRDEDGYPKFEMEYDKIAQLCDWVYGFMYETPAVFGRSYRDGDFSGAQYTLFKADRSLLLPAVLDNTRSALNDMESDYGIIPYPKYDENQEQYLTRIQDALALMCVPITNAKTELAGAMLEAMAAESYRFVTPQYFEIALKVKYSRDEISSQMLDIVREGAYLNFASIYNESIGCPWFVMRELMTAKSKDFASWYAKNEPKIIKALDKCVAAFEELG
jgi:ABC-type glycerol-3-phosphate transport system substrate-binding protein